MKSSKMMVYSLIGFIVCISILYRYPDFRHETGMDSFLLHNMADSISYHGQAKWVINPLSYFGMYAFSYPSAMPFLYSGVSQITSASIEFSILLSGIIFGVLGALFAFLAAREIKENEIFAFFTALTFSTAPFLLNLTTWEGSAKGFVVTLLPVFIFLLLKHLKTANTKFLALSILVLAIMAAMHRIGYIAIFIFFAYLFTLPLHNVTRYIVSPEIRYLRIKRGVAFIAVISSFSLALALLFISPGFLGSADITKQYSETEMLTGTGPLTALANLGISYTGKLGILVPLMFFGIFGLAWQERRNVQEKFLILSIIFLIPFIPMREYMTVFFVAVFSFLIGLSMYYLCRGFRKRKKTVIAIIIVCIVVSMSFSWMMRDYWREIAPYNVMTENTHISGIYVKHTLTRTDMFIANKGYVSLRITAISGVVSLPLGGASGASYNPQQLIYDDNFDIVRNEMDIRPVKFESISYSTNEIFTFNDPDRLYDAELNWANVLDHPCDGPYSFVGKTICERLNINYALETHDLEGQYVFWRTYGSWFLGNDGLANSVHHDRYKIYDIEEEALWFV
jgi:hypothetical protein